MDWTIPLKSQQRDFLARLNSISIDESSSLIHSAIPGCHREEMVVSGDRVRELRALCRQLILESDPSCPVRELLQIYLRAQLAREAISSFCANVLQPTDSIEQVGNPTLADFTLKTQSDRTQTRMRIRVKAIEQKREEDGENTCWCWSAAEIETCEAIACVLIREPVNEIAEEYHLVLAGFLPSNLLSLPGDEIRLGMEDLLYSGGFRGYLEGLAPEPESGEDSQTSDWLRPLMAASNYGYPLAIAADGRTLASCGYDGNIQIWQLDNPQSIETIAGYSGSGRAGAMGSGMQTPGSGDRALEVSQASSGQRSCTVTGHASGVSAISLTPDGRTLIGGGFDGIINVWQLPSGDLQHSLAAHLGTVAPIAIRADGRIFVTGGTDGTIKCWRVEDGQCLREFSTQGEPVAALAIRADGGAIAGGFADGTIKIWNLVTGELQQTLTGHGGCVRGLIFGEGGVLASSSIEPTVKVWDLPRKAVEQTLTGHLDPIVAISPNPDGQRIEVSLLRDRSLGSG